MKLTSQMPSSASLNIVAGLPRYAEIPANVRHGLAIQQAGHKAKALFHHRTRFPPHQHLPPAKGEKCYPCVRYGISPISRAAHVSRTFSAYDSWRRIRRNGGLLRPNLWTGNVGSQSQGFSVRALFSEALDCAESVRSWRALRHELS